MSSPTEKGGNTAGFGRYRCMPRAAITEGRYSVRAVEPEDIEAIRQWRNAQIDVLRQLQPIAPEQQVAYYAREIWPAKCVMEPRNILLLYLEDDRPIGYGGLVHISWENRRAEVSFLLDPAIPRGDAEVGALFRQFLRLMKILAFEDLGLSRLHTETFAMRNLHTSVLEDCGFKREGRLRSHVWIDGKPMDSLLHGLLAADNEQD